MAAMTDLAARHPEAVASVRAFADATGAQRVVLLVDQGDDEHVAMIEWFAGGAVDVTEGEESTTLPPGAPAGAEPHPLPHVHAVPPPAIAVDLESGVLSGPIGAVPLLGAALLALARGFGGRSVATADYGTSNPDLPITIAARDGEPLLLAVGEERFVLPEAP
jgi:hypothetical protein